jgi:uncharacterized protein YpmB
MSDQFYIMLGVVLPVLIVQGFQFLQQSRNAKKSEAARDEIKAQVAEVKDHLSTIATTKAEVQQQIAGAERQNVAKGIEIGKQQATGPAPLGK